MGRRLLAILAALTVAVVGAVIVVVYASAADSRAVAGQQTVEVYLARQVVPEGTPLRQAANAGLIARQPVVAKGVPAGALREVGSANEKLVATSAIQPGEIVLASRFGTKVPESNKPQREGGVPKGMVAVTVTLADAERVAPLLKPGAHVVLFDSFNPRDSKAALPTPDGGKLTDDAAGVRVTRVLLGDVQVIGVGSDVQQTGATTAAQPGTEDQSSTGTADGSLVTVAVTPRQSLTLVHAIQTGTLYAGLLGTDTKVDDGAVVTDDTVLNH